MGQIQGAAGLLAIAHNGPRKDDGMNGPRGFQLPFGDAFERFVINPVTNWSRFFNPQFFITYNAADVEVENHVLGQVGSYGKQIGRMQDVLEVLVARIPKEELTPQERRVLDDFQDVVRRVRAAVAEYRPQRDAGITTDDVDRLAEQLMSLERTNPEAHRRLLDRLRPAFNDESDSSAK